MTHVNKLKAKRKVETFRNGPLSVLLAPEGIWLREPRRHTAFLLPYDSAFQHAVQLHVNALRHEKAATKAAAKKARRARR